MDKRTRRSLSPRISPAPDSVFIGANRSWLFYFQALQAGDASKVVPIDKMSLVLTIILAGIFLREKISVQTVIGALMMTGGTLLIAFAK